MIVQLQGSQRTADVMRKRGHVVYGIIQGEVGTPVPFKFDCKYCTFIGAPFELACLRDRLLLSSRCRGHKDGAL